MKRPKGYPEPHADLEPTHPGKLLGGTVLPALGMSVAAAARAIGVSRQSLHAVIAGSAAVTPAMALRLGKFCGNGPQLWLAMQQAHDLWHAERALKKTLDDIETHKAA
jgi:addiction module HigA family antidote